MPPISELKHDMSVLKSKGFNLIKLQENWMLSEPIEGKFYFEKYHELIAHARKLDMGVYLGLTCEQAPNWLWEKHPNCRMIRKDGTPVAYQAQSTLSSDGKPGPCYDDPGAMAAQIRFIQKLVSELAIHENIVVWNTWQEIGYWAERLVGDMVCYCTNTIKSYQEWLQKLYSYNIDILNAHWNVRYPSFNQIEPDREKKPLCAAQSFYYHYFMENVQIANILSARYEAIKKADPLGRPIFAHKGWPELGSGIDWTYGRTQDFMGTSCYPAWGSGHDWDDHKQALRPTTMDKSHLGEADVGLASVYHGRGCSPRGARHECLLNEVWDSLAYRVDYIRSANKDDAPVWMAEFQGGPISSDYHQGRVPTAGDMRRWMLTSVGAGATGICFWITRAEIMAPETNGFALLDSEGDTTERLEEAAKIGKALQKYPSLFAKNTKPQAEIAILIDEWKYRLMKCLNFAPDALCYDLRGWYKLLWEQGISCDFIEASQLGDDKTGKYKAIIVPMPLSMSDEIAIRLIRYANLGGKLILEGGCGRLNEVAFAVRGQMNPIIREALGVKVETFTQVQEPGESSRWMPEEFSYGDYADAGFLEGVGAFEGLRIRANMFIETYDAHHKETCFMWKGKPAGVIKNVGKGKVLLIGTCVGPNSTSYVEPGFHKAAKGILMDYAGISKTHEGKLLISHRKSAECEALIITNPEKETVTESITIKPGHKVSDLLGSDVAIDGTITVMPLDVRILIIEPV